MSSAPQGGVKVQTCSPAHTDDGVTDSKSSSVSSRMISLRSAGVSPICSRSSRALSVSCAAVDTAHNLDQKLRCLLHRSSKGIQAPAVPPAATWRRPIRGWAQPRVIPTLSIRMLCGSINSFLWVLGARVAPSRRRVAAPAIDGGRTLSNHHSSTAAPLSRPRRSLTSPRGPQRGLRGERSGPRRHLLAAPRLHPARLGPDDLPGC